MANLVVVGFKGDMYRAATVLNELKRLNEDWVIDLRDAVAVYRTYQDEVRVDQNYPKTTAEGATWGGVWGTVIGALLMIPFTGGASSAVAAGVITAGAITGGAIGATGGAIRADWGKDNFGISDEFVSEVSSMIQPGDSAVFVLVRGDPTDAERHFRGWGGHVLRSTLSMEQTKQLEKALNDHSDR
ncbi:MAG: DUF1269 domain-containing protein [Anaerolineae bacterium]|nr:DUF1269 domain-containing protein [Anaerolineae bacterium]